MMSASAAAVMWRLCLCVLALSLSVLSQDSCPKDCRCSYTSTAQLAVYCTGESLRHVTSQLPARTVIYQYKAREPLVDLAATNFSHLPSLQRLQVSPYDHIALKRTIKDIPEDKQTVFAPLTNLRQLQININWELATALPHLFSALQRLETLDLSDTRLLDYLNLRDTLKGLENSTHFRTLILHNTQTMEILKNGFTLNLTDLLDPLKKCPLEELDISYNAIHTVIPGLISKAPGLKKIDASNNLIIPLMSGAFFFEVVSHPTLVEADFSQQGLGEPQRSSSNTSAWEVQMGWLTGGGGDLAKRPQQQQQQDYLMQPLYQRNKDCYEEVADNFCNIYSPACARLLHDCTVNHTYFCTLLTFVTDYSGYIPCDYIPPIGSLLSRDCGGCFVFPTTGNLRTLHLQMINNYDEVLAFPMFKDKTCFNPNNSLELLDFSRNREHGYADIDLSFSTTVQGFDSMKAFNLSYNKMQQPSPDLGSNLPQIEVFDLSFNLLDLVGEYGDFLDGATTMTELNLAGNVIEKIPYSRFSTLSRLQTLNLSSNNLHDFSVDLRNLSELSVIDLSGNKISSLSTDMMSQLEAQAKTLQNSSLKIDLSQNLLLCTCNVRDFMNWALSRPQNIEFLHFQEYMCLNDDSSEVRFHTRSKTGIFDCLGKNLYIGVGVGSGILLSSIVAALIIGIYRKRWWIRYHYFIARRMWINSRKQEEVSRQFRWDVFVSYSSRDQDWVDDVLQPKLEGEHSIKLCLHQRDFPLGSEITDQILASIDDSRKTLLILTPHFVESTWCHFEMRMAHQKLFTAGQDVILLAILKPLTNVDINRILKALLEEKVYVEWTDDQYGQKLFWAKLIAALDIPETPSVAAAGIEEEVAASGEPQRPAAAMWGDEDDTSDESPLIINHSPGTLHQV